MIQAPQQVAITFPRLVAFAVLLFMASLTPMRHFSGRRGNYKNPLVHFAYSASNSNFLFFFYSLVLGPLSTLRLNRGSQASWSVWTLFAKGTRIGLRLSSDWKQLMLISHSTLCWWSLLMLQRIWRYDVSVSVCACGCLILVWFSWCRTLLKQEYLRIKERIRLFPRKWVSILIHKNNKNSMTAKRNVCCIFWGANLFFQFSKKRTLQMRYLPESALQLHPRALTLFHPDLIQRFTHYDYTARRYIPK